MQADYTDRETEHKAANKSSLTDFGLEVRKRIIEKNITLIDIGERIGTSGSYISQIINARKSGKKFLGKIAAELDIDLSKYPREYEIHTRYMQNKLQSKSQSLTADANETTDYDNGRKDLANAQ